MKYTVFSAAWIVLAVLGWPPASAQELITDRPDFTESAAAVPVGHIQVESGITYEEIGDAESASFGEILVRVGVISELEARVGLNSYRWTGTPAEDFTGLEDFSLGAKYRISAGSEKFRLLKPELAVLVGVSLPTGAEEYGEDDPQIEVKIPLAWSLSAQTGAAVNVNWAYAGSGDQRFHQGSWSGTLSRSVGARAGVYAEYYGFSEEYKDGPDLHYINGGGTYLLADRMQFDVRAGHGMNGESPDWFAGLGFSILR